MTEHDERTPWRIIRGVGGNYWVRHQDGRTVQVQAPGVFREQGLKPIPGDLVLCEATGDELIPLRMTELLPRTNELPRPPLANLDALWILIPLAEPEPDLWMLDKMLVIAYARDIELRIIFTKEDLQTDSANRLSEVYRSAGYAVELSSPDNTDLLKKLRDEMAGHFIALAGPSGAGKSTLLNWLLEGDFMPIGEISEKLGRGRHTTRHVELFAYKDGYLADTPGFSSLDLGPAGITEELLVQSYPEIWAQQNDCRFLSCKHLNEPGCAVKDHPEIDHGRLTRYQNFREQLENYRSYERK